MSAPRRGMHRVRTADIRAVDEYLSPRDWRVIETLATVRLASARQLDSLCFSELVGRSQSVVRGRVVHRLIRWRVLRSFDRHIGGADGGSAALVVALDTVGIALAQQRRFAAGLPGQRYSLPGDRFVRHSLAVTQVFADLHKAVDGGPAQVGVFATEPQCWQPDGFGGQLKPDAYTTLVLDQARDHWWVEVDRGTESLPTLSRKLRRYVDFARRGQVGPGEVVPRVLVSVLNDQRLLAVQALVAQLPEPAKHQIVVVRDAEAALAMLSRLRE